jgi:deazaflavin-dependent oxidoreductase (nitroreductase family)
MSQLPQFMLDHIDTYIRTNGEEGYWFDARPFTDGKAYMVEAGLLKTKGRRSGEWSIAPLQFHRRRGEYLFIASNGGAKRHPAWFFNLEADPNVVIQIKDKVWKGTARIAEGAEREDIWLNLIDGYPHFIDYKARTPREFPFVLVKPLESIPSIR